MHVQQIVANATAEKRMYSTVAQGKTKVNSGKTMMEVL